MIIVALLAVAAIGAATVAGAELRDLFGTGAEAMGGATDVRRGSAPRKSAEKTLKTFAANGQAGSCGEVCIP
ncbi:MAG: hypothetical protein Q8S33_36915 [Myxococcales bacterium]|nr:hypothetical protein [Myxococcales bacterium]